MTYSVFLKAPTASTLKRKIPEDAYVWKIAKSLTERPIVPLDAESASFKVLRSTEYPSSHISTQAAGSQEWIIPPATLGAASQRVSEMYKNVIFADDDEEEDGGGWEGDIDSKVDQTGWDDSRVEVSKEETLISWPPTNPEQMRSRASLPNSSMRSQILTRDYSAETSLAHTSTSSIAVFPMFVISLHTLTNLSSLVSMRAQAARCSRKVNLLVAVLEVDGPDAVTIKKGQDAGKEVGVLKLVVGDEEGGVCKLTAWREVADLWGGIKEDEFEESMVEVENEGVRKGDIIYLQNILASYTPSSISTEAGRRDVQSGVNLTASPNLVSRMHICYRTLPIMPSDRRYRPDLRLAASDPGLRKVSGVVRWLQGAMGLALA